MRNESITGNPTFQKSKDMRTLYLYVALSLVAASICSAQPSTPGSPGKAQRDSVAHARMIADSLRIEKLVAISEYPYLKGTKWSGVVPVADPTEIPDPNREYKLLFGVTAKNPDSLAKDINKSLDEVARVLNLHVASGIAPSKITPVVLVYGPGLEALMSNESYQKKHSVDNPNIKLIQDIEKAGGRFIACGQAMAFSDVKKEQLLPEVKITLTAQTVLSNYQLQGYVLYSIRVDR
jgi:intracellular sulfur oxidation DsrE/DsrF family protein